jgi:lipopolysaccharide transport system permease protein
MLAGPEAAALPERSGEVAGASVAPDLTDEAWEITPHRGTVSEAIAASWRYRRLLGFFASRAIEKRYARTVLGRFWLLIRPLFPVVVAALVFGRLLGVGSEGRPYFLFFLVGSTLWSLFEGSLVWATRSLELNRKFLRRLYVPRLLLPVAMTAPAILDLGIRIVLIALASSYFVLLEGTPMAPLGRMPFALVPLALAYLLALGIASFTSVIGASVRDVRFALAYVLNLVMFLSPVLYPLDVVPERYRWIAALNPLTGLLEAFRSCVLGTGAPSIGSLVYALVVVAVLLAFGLRFFVRAEAAALDRA